MVVLRRLTQRTRLTRKAPWGSWKLTISPFSQHRKNTDTQNFYRHIKRPDDDRSFKKYMKKRIFIQDMDDSNTTTITCPFDNPK